VTEAHVIDSLTQFCYASSSFIPLPATKMMQTGIAKGHTGHVRFLTSVEANSSSSSFHGTHAVDSVNNGMSRHGKSGANPSVVSTSSPAVTAPAAAASGGAHLTTGSSGMLVVSGGDGYEDFTPSLIGSGISPLSETAGRDDSTNHLLLWSV
jgi:hypothetical protein